MDWNQCFELIDTRPFRPFEIELVNGRRLRIDDPDSVCIYPSRQKVSCVVVFHGETGEADITWGDGIAGLYVDPRDGEGSART